MVAYNGGRLATIHEMRIPSIIKSEVYRSEDLPDHLWRRQTPAGRSLGVVCQSIVVLNNVRHRRICRATIIITSVYIEVKLRRHSMS